MNKNKINRSLIPAIIALISALLVFLLALAIANKSPSISTVEGDETTDVSTTVPPISLPLVDTDDPTSTEESTSAPEMSDDTSDLSELSTGSPPETVEDTTTPAVIPPVLWDDSQTLSDRYEYEGELLYFKTVSFPVFKGGVSDPIARINDSLFRYASDFILITSNDKLLSMEAYEGARFDFENYECTASFDVYAHGNAVSVRFNVYQNNGGATSSYTTQSLTFDLNTGNRLSFAEYIGKDPSFAKSYFHTVFRQLIERSPQDYYDDALTNLESYLESADSLNNYYLHEDGVVLFFDAGTLSPNAHGIDSFTIPYVDLNK